MRELACMIVDDEPLAVKMIENYIARTEGLVLAASYNDPLKALTALDEMKVDVLFLDIQMPDLDGLNFSRQVPPSTKIIFTTAFKQYAFESYEVDAVDYLLKPIRYQKFLLAISKVRQRLEMASSSEKGTADKSIFIRVDNVLKRIDFDDILYVGGLKDYVHLYLVGDSRPLITHLTMKAVEDMLPSDRFMRVHRSYIIALDKIRSVDRNSCIYIGNEVIHVTEAYKEAFDRYLASKTAR
jgi:two-component system LytT family response regulator